jgi:ferredoxin
MALNKYKKYSWVKRFVQIAFFAFIAFIVITNHLESQGIELPWTAPGFHSVCPFGGVETIGRLVTEDRYIQKTHESNLWVLFGVLLSTALVGSVFCGWICPLGSIQDWIGKLGKKLFAKKYNHFVPKKIDYILSYLRYFVLGLVILKTTEMLTLVFMNVDPYYALFHFWTGDVVPSALIVLGIVLIASLFVERPWCRWLCPFGAVLGIVQLVSPWKIRRNKDICTNCGKCSRVCPMGIDLASKNVILDPRCNKCGECLTACTKEGGLTHSLGKRASINNRFITAGIILVLLFAPVVYAQLTSSFNTSNRPQVTRGNLSPEEIKGSMTFEELAKGFDMEYTDLKVYLELPDSITPDTQIKDAEDIEEFITTRLIRDKMSALQNS